METECRLRVVLCLLGLTMILMPAVHTTTLPPISPTIYPGCSRESEDPVDLDFSLACSPGHVNVTINKHSITYDTILVYIFCDCIYTDGNNNMKVERQKGISGNTHISPNSFDTRIATEHANISLSDTVKTAAGYNCTIRALSRATEEDCLIYFDGPTEPWCLHGEPTTTTTTAASYPSSLSSMSSIPSDNSSIPPTVSVPLPVTTTLSHISSTTTTISSSFSSLVTGTNNTKGTKNLAQSSSSTHISLFQSSPSLSPSIVSSSFQSSSTILSPVIPSLPVPHPSNSSSVSFSTILLPPSNISSTTPSAMPSLSMLSFQFDSSSATPSLSTSPSHAHVNSSSATPSSSLRPSHLNSSSTMPSSSMPVSNTPVSTPQLQLLLYFIIIPVVLVIAIALIISPLCLIIIQRYKKNNLISSFEFDQADTFFMKNRDLNITIKKHSDTISTLTGSVITIVQSLEVHIPSTDCTSNNESPSNSNKNLSQRNDIINETNINIKTFKEVHRTLSDNADKTTASHMMEAENELQESTSFHGLPSLSSISPGFNDCISCHSADSCGYIETTATKLSSSQFIDSLRASTDTSSPLHCPRLQIQPVPTLDDISIQSSQFSDDGYEQSATSEGYATERTSDYIETDNSGGLYPPLRATTAISMCNAQVNDYVFQKKINNKFVLQSSPSSSGYYSSEYTA